MRLQSLCTAMLLTAAAMIPIMPVNAQDVSSNEETHEKAPIATDINIEGPAAPIRGVYLASGAEKAPLVIILPGSGPTDKDGNNPLGVRAASYKLLAEGLAAQGIDTIRYDKRGIASSGNAITDPNNVRIADYGQDALDFAKQDMLLSGRKCVWLAGHSEGGVIALSILDNDHICGGIIIAAPGRPIGKILRTQLADNFANTPILEQANSAIDTLEAGGEVDNTALHPVLQQLFYKNVQPFLRDFMRYDPAAMIADIKKPMLLVYGDKDLQTPVQEGKLLKAANPNADLRIFADMNHVLKTVGPSERAANLQSYSDPNLALSEGVSAAIADFVKAVR